MEILSYDHRSARIQLTHQEITWIKSLLSGDTDEWVKEWSELDRLIEDEAEHRRRMGW